MLDLQPWAIVALLGTGFLAGFINVVAGGGSLLTMPLMIFLGLPEATANGTARIAIFLQNVSAVVRYRKEGRLDIGLARRFIGPALLGAAFGAAIAAQLGDAGFRSLLGLVMLGCALLVVIDPKMGAHAAGAARAQTSLRFWLTLVGIGLYGGLVQVGVGYLILAGLTMVLGMDLVEANIMKVVVVAAYTPIALVVFLSQGLVDWSAGLLLAVGQVTGAWIGVGTALQRGAGLIRAMLALVVVLSAVKLLGLF